MRNESQEAFIHKFEELVQDENRNKKKLSKKVERKCIPEMSY